MNLENIKKYLSNVESRDYQKSGLINDELNKIKKIHVNNKEEDEAKKIWILEKILETQELYLESYNLLKNEKYYEAWCKFEKCEISLHSLLRRYEIDENDKYYIKFILDHVKKYQSIFPYKIFLSPEIIILKKECSICDKVVSIRNPCGHIKGEIYNGEECVHTVTDGKILNLALVEDPAGKYRVPFQVEPETKERIDNYDYSLVKFLVIRLRSPFDPWDYKITTKYHNHNKFKGYGRNDKCPCGSGKKYKYCCLKNEGVKRPHYEFIFSKPFPIELQKIEYH